MLNHVVLLLLRGLLLCSDHPYQDEHLIHAHPHRIPEKSLHLQLIYRLSHVYRHELDCDAVHHFPVRAGVVRLGYLDPWWKVQPSADTGRHILRDDCSQHCDGLVLRTPTHTAALERTAEP